MPSRAAAMALALIAAAIAWTALPASVAGAPPSPAGESRVDRAVAAASAEIASLPPDERAEAVARLQEGVRADTRRHPMLRLFNMTNWWELPWFLIGLAGQFAFFARMAVQWIVSEKSRRSVVPPVFWWLSLVGSVFLVTYGIWRQDLVIILGQVLGVVIYGRNLWLIRSHRNAARDAEPETPMPEP